MTDYTFHPEYVNQFYLKLMGLNFLSNLEMPQIEKTDEEIIEFLISLKNVSEQLNDDIILELLNDTWRPSIAGAWMIGIGSRKNLADNLINKLKRSGQLGLGHNEHVLFNLLILDVPNLSQIIQNFVFNQLDYVFNSECFFVDIEKVSIDWAIDILHFLDGKQGTNHLQTIYSSDKWKKVETRYNDNHWKNFMVNVFQPHPKSQDKLHRLMVVVEKLNSTT